MSRRASLILGSLGGAFIVQASFVACSSSSSPGGAPDGGLLDAMIDAIGNVLDSATPDARADVDGSASCSCGNANLPGSRLKGIYTTGSDGTKQYTSDRWWDSQLGAECVSVPMSDGKQYCTPENFDPTDSTVLTAIYTDAACTTAVGVRWSTQTSGSPKLAYAQDWTTSAVGDFEHVFSVGAPTTAPAQSYSWSTFAPHACLGGSAFTPQPGQTFFSLTELPPSSFVALSKGHD